MQARAMVLIGMSAGSLAACTTGTLPTQSPTLANLGRGVDVLVIGEIHGTSEAPAAFGDLVEQAARRRRIAVGLELSDRTISGAGCGRTRPAEGTEWLDPVQDGRTSRAMRSLVCRLAALAERGRISLFGFSGDAPTPPGTIPHAGNVLTRVRSERLPTMILVGNYHARRQIGTLGQALSDAGLSLVTVTISYPSGSAFTCDRDMRCGPREVPARFCRDATRFPALLVGVPAGLSPELPWDGCLVLPEATPSPPV